MTKSDYDTLMAFFRYKLKNHPETGLSGNRAEGYRMAMISAMSKVRSMYKDKEDNK